MKKILFLLAAIITTNTFSQTGNIRGFVYEKESGEPVIFCNVFLKGTTVGSATDINGMYNISKVNTGTYTLVVTYIGYDTTEINISVEKGRILTQNIDIKKSSVKLNEVRISAERESMKTEVKAASIKISKQDLEMIPTIGGEPDLAQYMQVIPGVVFTGDQGGQLYIRGGSPIQNKVLLDGMIIQYFLIPAEGRFASVRQILSSPDYSLSLLTRLPTRKSRQAGGFGTPFR